MASVKEASPEYLLATEPRSFIDTNVLVYAASPDEPIKQAQALALIKRLRQSQKGVISTQVLSEFCRVALVKLHIKHANVRQYLQYWQKFEVVQMTPALIEEALDLNQTRSLGFFDAQIAAAALACGCSVLYSEDFNKGELIKGLRIRSPFE